MQHGSFFNLKITPKAAGDVFVSLRDSITITSFLSSSSQFIYMTPVCFIDKSSGEKGLRVIMSNTLYTKACRIHTMIAQKRIFMITEFSFNPKNNYE